MEIRIHRVEVTTIKEKKFPHTNEKGWAVQIYWTDEDRQKQIFQNRIPRAHSTLSINEFNVAIKQTIKVFKDWNKERLAQIIGGKDVKYIVKPFDLEEPSLIVKPGEK